MVYVLFGEPQKFQHIYFILLLSSDFSILQKIIKSPEGGKTPGVIPFHNVKG